MVDVRVPILVGVTGHRDIPSEDEVVIREAVRLRLTKLRKEYPHSPFFLISGLAEGADRLVAEVALGIDEFSLLAALPMEQAEYEKDFKTPASLEHFRRLISLADRCFVVGADEGNNEHVLSRDEKYLALGRYIARHSQIVIALWDGVTEQIMPNGKTQVLVGGTANVVCLCRSGRFSKDADQIVLPEITRVDHLYVRRTHQKETQGEHHALPVGEWIALSYASERKLHSQSRAMLSAIDRFNECAVALSSEELGKTRRWLIGDNAPQATTEYITSPIAVFSAADAAAGVRQTERSLAIMWVSALAMTSIVCQQIYSGPDMRWGWLASHIGFAFLAFFAFLYFFKSFFKGIGFKMGLTIEQARIIIKDVVGSSTRSNIQECELEYLQVITEVLGDGNISSIERKLLASKAKSLGISDYRAQALLEQEKTKLGISDASAPAVMFSPTSQGHSTNNDRQIESGQNTISPCIEADKGMQAQGKEAVANQGEHVPAPRAADQTEYDELCIEIRQVFNDGAERERDIAIVELARALNYQRTGKNIRETLSNALNAAVQRGILQNECDQLSLLCRSIEQFDRNFLKDQFIASLGGRVWTERDDAIKAFGRWMGFRRTGSVIDDTARSLINGLLREQRLESDGSQIRRVG